MKKTFENPSIESVRINAEEVTSGTGGVTGGAGSSELSFNPFG